MKYIDIKGVAKPVSKLIMGSDFFRIEGLENVSELLEQFVEMGGNTIDTAHIYCGGESEKTIGLWLENRKKREEIIIFTKGAHHNKDGPRVNRQAIWDELHTSLERMRTDYVDIYMLHRDDPDQPVGIIVEALNEHIEAGRVKAIGGSNWSHQRLQEANDYAASHGLIGFTASSPNLSLAKPNEPRWKDCISADAATIAWHEVSQIPILSWSSQAGGFFSGRFSPEQTEDKEMVRVYYSDANWERLRRAEKLGQEKGCTTIQVALAYVLNQSFPSAALVGARNKQELQSCVEALELELTREEVLWLDLRV